MNTSTATAVTRAAIYCRVSTDEQATEGTSLATQEATCRDRAGAEGWEVVKVYTDAGISGAKGPGDAPKGRPALKALLEAAQAAAFTVLLVTKTDRLGRSTRVLENVWGDLEDAGVGVLFTLEPQCDTRTPMGQMFRGVLAHFAQLERGLIAERTFSGRMARVTEGAWGGGPTPFGFRLDHSGGRGVLVLDDDEAATVRRAVSLLLDHGLSTREAARTLNAEGRLPRKATAWDQGLLRSHLRRGPWGGVYTWGKYAKRKVGAVPEPIQVPIPRLLEPERHAALLEYLKASTKDSGHKRNLHPMSGLLVGPCGHTFHGIMRADRGRRRYRCQFAKDTGKGWLCHSPSVLADDLDALVWGEVVTMLADPDALVAAAEEHLGLLAGASEAEGDALERAKREVQRCQDALAAAFTQALKAGLSDAVLEQTLAGLKADLAAAEAHVATVASWKAQTDAQADRVAKVTALAQVARERLQDADPALQAQVLNLLGVRVQVLDQDADGRPLRVDVRGTVDHDLLLGSSLAPSQSGITALVT